MIKELVIFEFKKTFMQKKTIIIISLLLLLVLGMLLVYKSLDNKYEGSKLFIYQNRLESLKDGINRLPDDQSNEKIIDIKEKYTEDINLINNQIDAYKTGNWKKELEIQIELDKRLLQNIQSGKVIGGEPVPKIQERIELNKEFLLRNIKPVDEDISTQGLYFLKNILNILMGLMGVILLLFLIGDILSSEIENGTIKFLFSQPISRNKIMISKFIAATLIFNLIILLVGLFAFLLSSALFGIGSSDYPILIKKDNLILFTSLIKFIINCIVLFIFISIFAISFIFFLSILTNHNMLAIGLMIIITTIIYFAVNNYTFFSGIALILPFSYINTFKIIDGTLGYAIGNNNLSLQNGIIVLSFTSAILYSISSVLIKRKNIL
jgi:ABC-2 type transport system permease protein